MRSFIVHAVLVIAAVLALITQAGDAKADSYTDMFAATDWLAKKYGVAVYVDQEPMAPGMYGYTVGNRIVFSSDYIADPALLRAHMASDVAHGFHPGEQCSAEQIVAAHEFAHVLDNFGGRSARYELVYALYNGLSGEVSGYSFNADGSVNYGEALADAFVAVECDVPTPAEAALYEMLVS